MKKIGEIILEEAKKQSISAAKLAKLTNLSTVTIHHLPHRKDITLTRLLQFSRSLNHDFLQYYRIHPDINPETVKALKAEITQLKQTIEKLQHENTLLTDVLQLLKSQKT
jgi:transcriptional regulator with XRE-family HTH domain